MPVVSQSMRNEIVPVGASTVAWELRTPWTSASSTALSQASWAAERSSVGTSSSSILATSRAVHPQHVEHRLGVLVEAGEGPHAGGGPSRGDVGRAGHERRDAPTRTPDPRRSRRASPRAISMRAEVGVAEAELAEAPRRVADLLGRVVGVADEDLLGGEDHLARRPRSRRRRSVSSSREEREQVQAGEVARGVVEVDVLASTGCEAVMRPVFGAVCQRLIVVSYCRPGIGALPRRLGDLTEQVARLARSRSSRPMVRADEVPVAVVDDRLHELVGDPDRVVGVLVLDRVAVGAVEVHVEAGLATRPAPCAPRGPCTR